MLNAFVPEVMVFKLHGNGNIFKNLKIMNTFLKHFIFFYQNKIENNKHNYSHFKNVFKTFLHL